MKNNDWMMWALGAAALWYLWRQGTFDQILGGFQGLLPAPAADAQAGNGSGVG